MDATRALLDELMGKERDLLPEQRQNRGLHFTDPEVCKHYICGFCPNELFTNTKSDLGPCKKIHDDKCKDEFQQAKKKNHFPYEREFLHFLERMVDDLDRRIKKAHDRLDVIDDKVELPVSGESADKLAAVSEKIQSLLQQIEILGEEGQVEESQKLMKDVDVLRQEKELILSGNDNSSQEKRMKVCDICGAFLVVGDTDKRASSHLEGKQHQGFALIRKTIQELKDSLREEESSRERDNKERYRGNSRRDSDRGDEYHNSYRGGGGGSRRRDHPYERDNRYRDNRSHEGYNGYDDRDRRKRYRDYN